jgi:hypothetical protein
MSEHTRPGTTSGGGTADRPRGPQRPSARPLADTDYHRGRLKANALRGQSGAFYALLSLVAFSFALELVGSDRRRRAPMRTLTPCASRMVPESARLADAEHKDKCTTYLGQRRGSATRSAVDLRTVSESVGSPTLVRHQGRPARRLGVAHGWGSRSSTWVGRPRGPPSARLRRWCRVLPGRRRPNRGEARRSGSWQSARQSAPVALLPWGFRGVLA